MNDYLNTKELYHHGIKGMRWGIIRKEYHQSQKERAAKKEASTAGIAAGAALGGVAGLGLSFLLNKSKVFKKKDGIFKEVGTGETYAHSMASVGKRAIGLAFVGGMLGRRIGKYNAMKKSQQEREREAAFDNFINARERFPMNSNQVSHSGIKGMKWGVRRYQNEDGTLTEEGKKRYQDQPEQEESKKKQDQPKQEESKKKQDQLKQEESKKKQDQPKQEESKKKQDPQEKYVGASMSIAKSASDIAKTAAGAIDMSRGSKTIRRDYSWMTDQQLQARINRLNLERTYGDLSGETKYVKTGKEKAREILQTLGASLAIGYSALQIYKEIHNMMKKNN